MSNYQSPSVRPVAGGNNVGIESLALALYLVYYAAAVWNVVGAINVAAVTFVYYKTVGVSG